MWTPTLDDVINAPRDPDDLRMHLQSIGALPAPPAAPATPLIPELVPPKIGTPSTAPAVPLRPPTRIGEEHLPAMKTSELAEPSGMMTPPIVSSPDAISSGGGLVKPMTAPTLTDAQQKQLPLTSPGMEGGSLPFYQSQLDRAIEANRHDSMSDHPSFLGKVGHVLGRVGNVALNAFVPGLAETIPGTDAYKVATEQRAKRELAGEQARESKEKLESAETARAEAEAKKLGQENEDLITDKAGNLVGWQDAKGKHSLEDPSTPQAIKDMAKVWQGTAAAKPQKENLEQGLAGAVQKAIDNGEDPKDNKEVQGWAQAIKDYKPTKDKDVNTAEDLKHRIVVAAESGNTPEVARLTKLLTATDPEGMARLAEAQARFAETREQNKLHQEEHEEKQGLKWVTGETEDGQTVTVPFSQAKAMGLKNQAEAGQEHVGKVLAARVVVPMLYSNDPADPGVLQLIDQLDKNGDLGAVASRWNDFMTRHVGTDTTKDQLYTKLRTKLDLAQTKMMQAHVGSRGGSYMLEHFEDLANAGKLDAKTLRAATDVELRYMYRNSEKPPSGAPSSGGKGGHNFSINGKEYHNVPDDLYKKYKGKPGFKE